MVEQEKVRRVFRDDIEDAKGTLLRGKGRVSRTIRASEQNPKAFLKWKNAKYFRFHSETSNKRSSKYFFFSKKLAQDLLLLGPIKSEVMPAFSNPAVDAGGCSLNRLSPLWNEYLGELIAS